MKFEKLHELKKGKHAVTGLCLALGVTLLSSAVYASYDDANGYQNYKEAVKSLVFKEKNVTAEVSANLYADGEKILSYDGEFAVDGDNYKEKYKSWNAADGKEIDEEDSVNVEKGGKTYEVNNISKTYDVYDGALSYKNGLFDVPNIDEDPAAQKFIRFAELAADAFIGDIKNNVVLESKNDGIRNYTVSASEVQIPEVINAGMAVLGTTFAIAGDPNYVDVRYEDYDAARNAYYKAKTGQDLPENYYELDDKSIEDVIDGFYEQQEEYRANKKGGVLVVYSDSSMKYYASPADAMNDPKNAGIFYSDDYVGSYMGKDAWIKSGTNDFSIDENGKLVSTDITMVLGTKDTFGKEHELKLVIKCKLKDYGTTNIELPDLSKYDQAMLGDEKTIPYAEEKVTAVPEAKKDSMEKSSEKTETGEVKEKPEKTDN